MSQSGTIARNTLIMYIRMFVMMIIGIYTSRVSSQVACHQESSGNWANFSFY